MFRIYDKVPFSVQKILNEGPKNTSSNGSLLKRTVSARPPNNLPAGRKPTDKPAMAGGAQRVLKPIDSPSLTPGSKAARVAVNQNSPIKQPPGLRSSLSLHDTSHRSHAPSSLATCVSAGQLCKIEDTTNSLSASSIRSEIVSASTSVKSSDWSARNKGFESLSALLGSPETINHVSTSKPASQRLFEVLMIGLTDSHFRVLESALKYGSSLFQACGPELLPDPYMADNLLAKSIYLAVNPQFKGKPCQEEAPKFIDSLKCWLRDPWKFFGSLSAAYAKPEATMSIKVRNWIMSRLVEEVSLMDLGQSSEHEILFSTFIFHFKNFYFFLDIKITINRITPALLDHDQALLASAVNFFAALKEKVTNNQLFDTLILSVKFSSARNILLDKLRHTLQVSSSTVSVISKSEPIEELQEDPEPTTKCQSLEDMQIEREDDPAPITLDSYVVLDEELGIELRVKHPRSPTPPVEELARTLSSVLRSPFPEEKEPEMKPIECEAPQNMEPVKADNLEDSNPFL